MAIRPIIIDYGMGNLDSVQGALKYLGCEPETSRDPRRILNADSLILPGVGSFKLAMQRLDQFDLINPIKEAVLSKQIKILGICLGQQLMAEYGEENGLTCGLGLIPGHVQRFDAQSGIKVPHIGFNQVSYKPQSYLFRNLQLNNDFYFVHSYRMGLEDREGLEAVCDYGGKFLAAYEKNNIFATQFHPEKSQTNGLRLLSNFITE